MTFKEYQHKARQTAIYPASGYPWVYPALGLCGETGEIMEKLKRVIRDGTEPDREALKKELGDVLWYLSNLAWELGIDLEEVAVMNLEKLLSRQKRNALQGTGDDR